MERAPPIIDHGSMSGWYNCAHSRYFLIPSAESPDSTANLWRALPTRIYFTHSSPGIYIDMYHVKMVDRFKEHAHEL